MNTKDLIPISQKVFHQLVVYLNRGNSISATKIHELIETYKQLKSGYGGKRAGKQKIAKILKLNDNDISLFESSIDHLKNTIRRLQDVGDGDSDDFIDRNCKIAQFRFMLWIETISSRNPNIHFSIDFELFLSEDKGWKQVRALELIIRSLINESYQDQDALVSRLKAFFSDDVVEGWINNSDKNGVLSGTTFSELAGFFVNKTEFVKYKDLYENSRFLSYLNDRRKTIQMFLEDIRILRNDIAHNREISNVQLSLIDCYYDEIITPVKIAYNDGKTKINPDMYLDVSKEEIDEYFKGLRVDVLSVKDSIFELKSAVDSSFDDISKNNIAVKEWTQRIDRKLIYLFSAVSIILCFAIIIKYQIIEYQNNLFENSESVAQNESLPPLILDKEDGDINRYWKHLRYSFFREEYVNPRIVHELSGWISDSAETVTQIDLVESNRSNRFYAEYEIRKLRDEHWVFIDYGEDNGFFAYNYIASSPSGIHILKCAENTGGSGTFVSLMFLTLSTDQSFDQRGNGIELRERVLLKTVGSIVLGDRYDGKISYDGRKLRIGPDESMMKHGQRLTENVMFID